MADDASEPTLCCKIVMIGNSGVGKTSLSLRWINGEFNKTMEPTIGANHMTKRISVEGQDVNIFMWDTAGQEQFKSLAPVYTRSAAAVVLVVSTTDMESVNSIDYWVNVICETNDVIPPFILAINKNDLRKPDPAMESYINSKINKFEGIFFVSALTGEEIDNLFLGAASAGYHFVVNHANHHVTATFQNSKQVQCC